MTSQLLHQLYGHAENTSCDIHSTVADVTALASYTVACAYFGHGLEMMSFYCCMLECVYGAVAWQWVFTIQYHTLNKVTNPISIPSKKSRTSIIGVRKNSMLSVIAKKAKSKSFLYHILVLMLHMKIFKNLLKNNSTLFHHLH
jgi:hypothetical protein